MNKKIHFISGLPRSGSTLLTSILNQNPKFHAEISDPVAEFLMGIMHSYSQETYYKTICSHDRMKNALSGLIDGYYAHVNKEIIFNTNRGWTKITECLSLLDENFKIICTVRDFASILNSFEILYKKRGFSNPIGVYNNQTLTVYTRTRYLAQESSARLAYDSLKEAYFGPHRNHLMLVEYDHLVTNPEETMKSIYQFIDEPYFKHNFKKVGSSFAEYDQAIGFPNLHTVQSEVKLQNTQRVLPPDLYDQYKNLEFWRNA
jgi:sulfotransferase